jgi:hypothetical protein
MGNMTYATKFCPVHPANLWNFPGLKIRIPSILMYIYTKESYAFSAESVFFALVFAPGGAVFDAQIILVCVFADRGRVGLFYKWGTGWPYRHKEASDHQVSFG